VSTTRPAAALGDLQRQPGAFHEDYNENRPNRALHRSTPGQAYRAMPKSGPAGTPHGYYRLRYDHVDAGGEVSIRRADPHATTWASAPPTAARKSSRSPAPPASPSSNCEPAKSYPPTTSTRPRLLAQQTAKPGPMAGLPVT
jgi:hypothetical protein